MVCKTKTFLEWVNNYENILYSKIFYFHIANHLNDYHK